MICFWRTFFGLGARGEKLSLVRKEIRNFFVQFKLDIADILALSGCCFRQEVQSSHRTNITADCDGTTRWEEGLIATGGVGRTEDSQKATRGRRCIKSVGIPRKTTMMLDGQKKT